MSNREKAMQVCGSSGLVKGMSACGGNWPQLCQAHVSIVE